MKCIEIRENGTKRVYTINNEASRVQTQFQEQTDVNNIVKAYSQNPDPSIFRGLGNFQDNTLLGTYQDSLDLVLQANDSFQSLPANIRDRFKNDPAKLLAFMQDPSNYEEGVSLGLVKPNENVNAPIKQNEQNEQNKGANTNTNASEGTEKS